MTGAILGSVKPYKGDHLHRVQNYTHLDKYLDETGGYDVVSLRLREPIKFDENRQKLVDCGADNGINSDNLTVGVVGMGYVNKTYVEVDGHMQKQITEADNLMVNIWGSLMTR